MHVPLLDLKAQYTLLKPELDAAMIRVAESQVCVLGNEVEELERNMAEYCGTRFALGVSSGTDALLMALMALGIGTGDEVIVPTFSFFATAGVVARLGATPVFVDSESRGLNLDPARLEECITPRTKAIIPVHLFGQCADMQAIMNLAAKYSIPVIEDAAQAIGAEYVFSEDNAARKAGSMGLMGCFSFYPTKNLGAFGDAGLITTNNEALYVKLKQMRNHGMEPRYYHKFVGGNFRMDALQAAVLNVKFTHLESWHEARRKNAALYNHLFVQHGLAAETLKHEPCNGFQNGFPHCPNCASAAISAFDGANTLLLPEMLGAKSGVKNHHIFHQYTLRVPHRDKLRTYLAECGIGAEVYYPVPLHKQECFAHLASNDEGFRVANCAATHVLSLPIYPELQEAQVRYVVERIAAFYQK